MTVYDPALKPLILTKRHLTCLPRQGSRPACQVAHHLCPPNPGNLSSKYLIHLTMCLYIRSGISDNSAFIILAKKEHAIAFTVHAVSENRVWKTFLETTWHQ